MSAMGPAPFKTNYFEGYNPAVSVLIAFALGILLDRQFDLPLVFSSLSLVGLLLLWCGTFVMRQTKAAAIMLLLAIAAAGAIWHYGRWNWFPDREISRFADETPQPVCLRAKVVSEPRHSTSDREDAFNSIPACDRTRLLISVTAIRDGDDWQSASGRADLVIHAHVQHISSGDEIMVFGSLVSIKAPTNPGQFNFRNYYRSQSKLASLHAYFQDAVVVERWAENFSNSWILSNVRRRLNEVIWQYVDADRAGLASAVLLGNREQLGLNRRDQFLYTGTVHLLAISGLHVGILAGVFLLLYQFGLLSRRASLLAVVLFVMFYAWLVEFRPPVCRAAILLTLFCMGKLIGRAGFSFNLLAIAGLIVLAINPSDLFQLGPQLSFLAVATLITFKDLIFKGMPTDPLELLVYKTRPLTTRLIIKCGQRCRQALLVSALIWLVAAPLVALHYHLVAPVALIVNPLLLIPITFALYGGLGVLVFGGWFPTVADFFGWVCDASFGCVESMVAWAARLPGSHWWTAGPSAASVTLFYFALMILAIFLIGKVRRRWLCILGVAWLVFGWLVPFQIDHAIERSGSGELICTFVDVGHGTCVLVQIPGGKSLLYDAGSFGSAQYGVQNISGVLWSENIEHLDAVVISHADIDHFNALPELCHRFSIACVYMTPVMLESQSEAVQELIAVLNRQKVRVEEISLRDKLICGQQVHAQVLSPPQYGTRSTDNSDSIVLLLEFFGKRILLPGDLELFGMQFLLSQKAIDCDIAMSPHHGSQGSQQREFIGWCDAEHVVVSCSDKKTERGVIQSQINPHYDVYETGKLGAIRFAIDRNRIDRFHWADGQWQPINKSIKKPEQVSLIEPS